MGPRLFFPDSLVLSSASLILFHCIYVLLSHSNPCSFSSINSPFSSRIPSSFSLILPVFFCLCSFSFDNTFYSLTFSFPTLSSTPFFISRSFPSSHNPSSLFTSSPSLYHISRRSSSSNTSLSLSVSVTPSPLESSTTTKRPSHLSPAGGLATGQWSQS